MHCGEGGPRGGSGSDIQAQVQLLRSELVPCTCLTSGPGLARSIHDGCAEFQGGTNLSWLLLGEKWRDSASGVLGHKNLWTFCAESCGHMAVVVLAVGFLHSFPSSFLHYFVAAAS